MAYGQKREIARITLEPSDLDTLRTNGVLAVRHPTKVGIVLFNMATANYSHSTNGILASPLITGETTSRLEDGEIITYTSAKLEVRLAPEYIA